MKKIKCEYCGKKHHIKTINDKEYGKFKTWSCPAINKDITGTVNKIFKRKQTITLTEGGVK